MDQVDHGDHDPPWWTRSVQDHLGPRSHILLMSVYANKQVPDGGLGHLHPVNISLGLPLDLFQPGREGAVLADDGWLIYPEIDGARADDTCRSHISIYCAYSIWMV